MSRGKKPKGAPDAAPRPPGGRKAARLAAVQALYQIELTGLAPDRVLREFASHGLAQSIEESAYGRPDPELFAAVVLGVAEQQSDLDDMIAGVLSEDWTVERLEAVLRAILRAGAFELSARRDIPARVTINEYVDIADAFFGGKQPALVNGVLDRLGHLLRPDELEAGGERNARAR